MKSVKEIFVIRLYSLFYFIAGGFLAIAFGTYSEKDPGIRVAYLTSVETFDFHNKAGKLGAFISDILFSFFGWISWAIVVFFLVNAIFFFIAKKKEEIHGNLLALVGLILFLLTASVLAATLSTSEMAISWGGVLGRYLSDFSQSLLGPWGSVAVWGVLSAVLAIFTFNISIRKLLPWFISSPIRLIAISLKGLSFLMPRKKKRKMPIALSKTKRLKSKRTGRVLKVNHPLTPPSDGEFHLPGLDLLSCIDDMDQIDMEEVQKTAHILMSKLRDFGIDGEVVHANPGPVITTFEFTPASGIKISKIANLSDDLTMALSSHNVRIIAPLPGKPSVGIEIPNRQRHTVFLKPLLESDAFKDKRKRIPLILGKNAFGEPMAVDVGKMPHLLVAGATGAGKSVFINSMICGLLYRFSPQQLRMIMIDPKMVELSVYEGIPHLLAPVVTQPSKAASALNWAVLEMERRYSLLHEKQVRHIDAYNQKVSGEDFLPYIVVVVDEFADLMITSAKDVEYCIARLAQKARASGIHLILATQRPSVDVITGTIKANFTARISFKVSSKIDSRTILDTGGADRLLGKGDMLFTLSGSSGLQRVHGAFVSDKEIHELVGYFRQNYSAQYDIHAMQAIEEGVKSKGEHDVGDDDPMFSEAVAIVKEYKTASISFLQRKLKIGYNRAARIIEKMEELGWVSPSDGTSKSRVVRIPPDL